MSTPENNADSSQAKQGFILPKKKRKQVSSSVLAGIVLLVIMVGSLYWFQHQAQLKKEMDGLIEANKAMSSSESDMPVQENEKVEELVILEEKSAEPVVEEKTEIVLEPEQEENLAISEEKALDQVETAQSTVLLDETSQEDASTQDSVSVSLRDSQPLFENILATQEPEESEEKKKVVVEFDIEESKEAVVEPELKEVSSKIMAFESLKAEENNNAINVAFALKNLNNVKHRGVISFAILQADGTRTEIAQPQGTYSFRMRVDKKYTLPITAQNKDLYDKAFAIIVDIKDGNGAIILSKPYKL